MDIGTTSCEVIGTDIVVINARPDFNINLSTTDPSNSFCQEKLLLFLQMLVQLLIHFL